MRIILTMSSLCHLVFVVCTQLIARENAIVVSRPMIMHAVLGNTGSYYRIAGKSGGELNLAVWRFGGLAVLGETAKLKSAKIYTVCMYVWRCCSRPPNLKPRIHGLEANRQI